MHVVATAGHVDHGKSTLVRALTGMEPDRWAEERRRGLTIDLGFAWTSFATGDDMAFVDVPGHERFVTNMLAGIGSVPAVMLVVAADEGWMPQTDEHVRALDALGVRCGLLVVTKSDLADPQDVASDVERRLVGTTLATLEPVTVSSATGAGLDDLRSALVRLGQRLPRPDADAPVRLWVDRCFTIAGAGTVVTGTLAGGTVSVGDRLDVAGDDKTMVVRGIQSRGEEHESVTATARVALNLRGVDRDDLGRGAALVTSGRWLLVDRLDVYVASSDIARDVVVHIGSAAVPATTRQLGENALRLRLSRRVPLHYGDRLLLREPSSRAIVGATVADLAPTPLRRRGDAAVVASALRVPARASDEVRRRGVVDVGWLTASGLAEEPDALRIADRWVDSTRWELWRTGLRDLADQERGANGLPVEVVRDRLALPDSRLLAHLVGAVPAFEITNGHVRKRNPEVDLSGLDDLLRRLAGDPFAAPDGEEIRRLDRGALVRGVRAGCLLQLGPGMYVAADAPDLAITRLGGLPQPFTVSAATRALGSTRRVVVPLLEHLDAARKTQRLPDGTRLLVGTGG